MNSRGKQPTPFELIKGELLKKKKGNAYLKIEDHVVVIYYLNMVNVWKYSIDETFCQEAYQTKEIAMNAAFETLETIRKQDNPI